MSSIAPIFCVFCISLSGPPHPQLSREAPGIRYTHEMIGQNTHLLRLSTEHFLFDSDRTAQQHMSDFAAYFAANTCPGRFSFESRRDALPPVRPILAHNFVFRCR